MDDDDRRNLLARREIIAAYVEVLGRPEESSQVCASVSGDADAARSAVGEAFGVSEHAAMAILDLQVRRFTPHAIERVRGELADVDHRLAEIAGSRGLPPDPAG